jgi:hypothetical protein
VIGVALFPERQRAPRVAQELSQEQESRRFEKPAAPQSRESDAAGNAESSAGAAADQSAADKLSRHAPAPAPSLGTGHGRREHSVVTQVPFERARSTPEEVIRIRYDSHENLLALGVIHRPPPRPRGLDPFPRSPQLGYVPDP